MSQYEDDFDRLSEDEDYDDMNLLWLDSTDGKPWVAKITGLDTKFGLAREFVAFVDRKKGQRAYPLEDGVLYQVQPTDGEELFFLMVGQGEETVLTTEQAMECVEFMERDKAKGQEAIDNAIARINSEGGFRMEPSDN